MTTSRGSFARCRSAKVTTGRRFLCRNARAMRQACDSWQSFLRRNTLFQQETASLCAPKDQPSAITVQPMTQAYDYWQDVPSQKTRCFARNFKRSCLQAYDYWFLRTIQKQAFCALQSLGLPTQSLAQPMRQAYDCWQEVPAQKTRRFTRNFKRRLEPRAMIGSAHETSI